MKKLISTVLASSICVWSAGCALTDKYTAGSIEELKKVCETFVPCEPCPKLEDTTTANDIVVDDIDMRVISWDEALFPKDWPITAMIAKATISPNGVISAQHIGTDIWPVRPDGGSQPSVGNWWIIAKCEDNLWHGATIEWLGKGKTTVTGKRWDGTDGIRGCLSNWKPRSGEKVGIMLTTVARGAPYTIKERTQNVIAVVP